MLDDKKNQDWQSKDNPNENVVFLEHREIKFFTKIEVATQWQVSQDTFQKWITKEKPENDQVKIQENTGKKLFKEEYIEKLIKKFRPNQTQNLSKTKEFGNPEATLYKQIISSKDETIKILENQIKDLKIDLATQNTTHSKNLENLTNQFNFLATQWQLFNKTLESKKKAELLENLPKKTNQNWKIRLLLFFNLIKLKDPPNDN